MSEAGEPETIRAVERALIVLEVMNEQRVSSIDTLHRKTGIPKPTLVRLLATLGQRGYVSRVARRDGYELNERVLRLTAGFQYHDAMVDVARPLLDDFTRRHDWQLSFATQVDSGMLFRYDTHRESPFAPNQRYLNTHARMLASAVGRVFLAYCSAAQRDILLARQAPGDRHEFVLPEYPNVTALLAAIRERGYATARRAEDDPVRSFAIPVLSPATGLAIGSLVMFYYRAALTEKQATASYIDEMRDIAARIAAIERAA